MIVNNVISPREEMNSYETIWALRSETQKSIADRFKKNPILPSKMLDLVKREMLIDVVDQLYDHVREFLDRLNGFSVSIHGDFQYPKRLQDSKNPAEVFYYRGDISLIESRCISIVGARSSSDDGLVRARKLAKGLVAEGFTIVSGLAKGIDTAAMTAAIEAGGRTVGVIGTPINDYYPKENRDLQDKVACEHLLISHVPFYRYHNVDHFRAKPYYFPQRNEIMAALSEATVIVEASDKSGSLTQARACFQQGRKLFILNSCFENPAITWPKTYEKRGAIRVRELADILEHLPSNACSVEDAGQG